MASIFERISRARMGAVPPVAMPMTTLSRSTKAGVWKSARAGLSTTLTRAPAERASAASRAASTSSSIAMKTSRALEKSSATGPRVIGVGPPRDCSFSGGGPSGVNQDQFGGAGEEQPQLGQAPARRCRRPPRGHRSRGIEARKTCIGGSGSRIADARCDATIRAPLMGKSSLRSQTRLFCSPDRISDRDGQTSASPECPARLRGGVTASEFLQGGGRAVGHARCHQPAYPAAGRHHRPATVPARGQGPATDRPGPVGGPAAARRLRAADGRLGHAA